MGGRRVFRDWTVLLVASTFNQPRFKGLLEQLGFARFRVTDQDRQVPALVRSMQPNLVMIDRQLKVFSGVQLLVACRQDQRCAEVPFLIVGDKDDFRPGGLAERVAAFDKAHMVAEPLTEAKLGEALDDLVSQFIDLRQEEALRLADEADRLAETGDYEAALKLLEEAAKLHGDHIDIQTKRAAALAQVGRLEEAEEAYRRVLEADPNNLRAYFGLAEVYEALQKFEQAIEVVQKAGQVAKSLNMPGSQQGRIHLFIGEFDLKLEKLKEAAESFKEAVDLDPDNAQLKSDIGDAYASRGYHEEAEAYYEAAMAQDPRLAHIYNRLGITYRRQAKYNQALEVYKKALRIRPKDDHLLFNIARTLDEAGRREEAEKYLDRAIRIAPNLKEAKALKASFEAKKEQLDGDEAVPPPQEHRPGAVQLKEAGPGKVAAVARKVAEDPKRDRGTFGRFDKLQRPKK